MTVEKIEKNICIFTYQTSVNDLNLNDVCVFVVIAWNGEWSDEYLFSYWFDRQNDGILY